MDLRVFGTVHLIYLAITVPLSVIGLLLAKKFAKTEKAQSVVLKSLGGLLLIWIIINRLSQVYRYSDVRWEQIIPDSFCGMTSLVFGTYWRTDHCVQPHIFGPRSVGFLLAYDLGLITSQLGVGSGGSIAHFQSN